MHMYILYYYTDIKNTTNRKIDEDRQQKERIILLPLRVCVFFLLKFYMFCFIFSAEHKRSSRTQEEMRNKNNGINIVIHRIAWYEKKYNFNVQENRWKLKFKDDMEKFRKKKATQYKVLLVFNKDEELINVGSSLTQCHSLKWGKQLN